MDNLNAQVFSQPEKSKKFSAVKIIFLILGVIIVGELIYAGRMLIFPTKSSPALLPLVKAPARKTAGIISLTTPKATVNVKDIVPVAVVIDTGGHLIGGADLVINFDPKFLEVNTNNLIKGKIFDEYPLLSVNKGIIAISGINNSKNVFTGKDQFAVINFTAKQPGNTIVTVEFKSKGVTTDSNLVEVETSKDILEKVESLKLNIQ